MSFGLIERQIVERVNNDSKLHIKWQCEQFVSNYSNGKKRRRGKFASKDEERMFLFNFSHKRFTLYPVSRCILTSEWESFSNGMHRRGKEERKIKEKEEVAAAAATTEAAEKQEREVFV